MFKFYPGTTYFFGGQLKQLIVVDCGLRPLVYIPTRYITFFNLLAPMLNADITSVEASGRVQESMWESQNRTNPSVSLSQNRMKLSVQSL